MRYIQLLRPHQWVKNLFLFIPIFFAGHALSFGYYPYLLLGFLSFSLIASAVYILNDICDYKVDQAHPKKKLRPIASGKVGLTEAKIVLFVVLAAGLLLAFFLNPHGQQPWFFYLLLIYLLINLGYSFGLKNVSILDILMVASGFLIRIYCGGVLTDTHISPWLSIMILLLSLFLALAKRRDDLVISNDPSAIRKVSKQYNLEFINSGLSIFAGIIIVAYILYTLSPDVIARFGTEWLFTTAIFVIAGVLRYLQITFVENNSGSPSSLLYKDNFILITVLGWIISFYIIIYIV